MRCPARPLLNDPHARGGALRRGFGRLIWNHGGSGDDVEQAHPGHVVSILTPTSGYAKPFVHYLAEDGPARLLCIVHGPGRFGRQVAEGAAAEAEVRSIPSRMLDADELPPTGLASAAVSR